MKELSIMQQKEIIGGGWVAYVYDRNGYLVTSLWRDTYTEAYYAGRSYCNDYPYQLYTFSVSQVGY